jgi:hypothetical protein
VLLRPPNSFTSLKSRAQVALASAGGAAGRTCEALASSQGLRCGHCGTATAAVGT